MPFVLRVRQMPHLFNPRAHPLLSCPRSPHPPPPRYHPHRDSSSKDSAEQFKALESYCVATTCRHKEMAHYFGEDVKAVTGCKVHHGLFLLLFLGGTLTGWLKVPPRLKLRV